MYTATYTDRQTLGLHRLTGGTAGEVFTNERKVSVTDPETDTQREVWAYDIYQVSDSRDPHGVKNEVIAEMHPSGDETKILRKTLARLLKETGRYDLDEWAQFRAYNEFAESIDVRPLNP